jgi:pyruvate formate lyase activating enzyme
MKRQGLEQVAFTYTEPLTWYEYISDFALLASSEAIDIVLVSNGYINPEPFQALVPYISAMNIDLKGMDDSFYREHCGAELKPVLDTIGIAYQSGIHIELTNLLIPGLNTETEQVLRLVDFVAGLDRSIPLHFSKYHPAYKSQVRSTSDSIIRSACELAHKKLYFVYAGNTKLDGFYDTICPNCQKVLVSNRFYQGKTVISPEGRCPACGSEIYGVFKSSQD